MMSMIFSIVFLLPLSFLQTGIWMVQSWLFFICFGLILMNSYSISFGSISYGAGIDLLSYGMVLLSVWISSMMFMASEKIYFSNSNKKYFIFNILLLLLFLTISFSALNLLVFYIFFESSLIPTLFLIMGWGSQPERLQAGLYLLLYTLLASLPMLIGVLFVGDSMGSMDFYLLGKSSFEEEMLYLSMTIAFLVKMPMFLVHIWLPKAHVEAPISGSMVLAGVMLKLGGYGLIRVMEMFQEMTLKFSYLWISVSLVGGLMVSLICLRQSDMKLLVAYSSVVHMGMALASMMTLFSWGLCGGFSLMVAHGLCSSGLFCLVNICYERTESRSLLVNRGMLNFLPSFTVWWFLLSTANMAAPPSLNLMSEVSMLSSLIAWSWLSILTLCLICFFSAAYSIYLYSFSQHGKFYSSIFPVESGTVREFMILCFHWVPIILLVMKSELVFYLT